MILALAFFNQYLPSSKLISASQKLMFAVVCAKVKD